MNLTTQFLPGISGVVGQCGDFRFCRFPDLVTTRPGVMVISGVWKQAEEVAYPVG